MELYMHPSSKIHELTSRNVLNPFLNGMMYCTHAIRSTRICEHQLLNPVHKSEYNAACTAGMALAYLRMLIHEFPNKDEYFSENPGKVHFEGLIHLLRYIRDNKTLGMKYYAYLNDAPVTDLLRQANIKIKNNLMYFSDYIWQDCPDTGRSTGAYIIFYQGGPINHGTHVPGPVAKSSAEI